MQDPANERSSSRSGNLQLGTLWVKPQQAMQSTSEHDRILDALRSHDADRVAEETERHIRTAGDYLIASIAGASQQALGN